MSPRGEEKSACRTASVHLAKLLEALVPLPRPGVTAPREPWSHRTCCRAVNSYAVLFFLLPFYRPLFTPVIIFYYCLYAPKRWREIFCVSIPLHLHESLPLPCTTHHCMLLACCHRSDEGEKNGSFYQARGVSVGS